MNYQKLNGDDGVVIYRLHYVGGDNDGMIANSLRPYYELFENGGQVYRAKEEPPNHEVWVDDFTRDIFLHYAGVDE